MQENRW